MLHNMTKLEDIMVSEIRQSQKNKYYDSTYMWYLEYLCSEKQKMEWHCQGLGETGSCLVGTESQFFLIEV